MAEVLFRAKLLREESSKPWGFRLQGGVEFDKPLTLLKVVEESIAAKSGLHAGDIVVKLAGEAADGMTHKNAQNAIRNAGNALEIIVERAEEEITLSPPNSPPSPAVSKAKPPASTAGNKKDDKKPPALKPAIKQEPKGDEKKLAPKLSPSNSPAIKKKNVKFADDESKKVEKEAVGVTDKPPTQPPQNDIQKNSDSKSVAVGVVDGGTSRSALDQDANIPANSDQKQPPVENNIPASSDSVPVEKSTVTKNSPSPVTNSEVKQTKPNSAVNNVDSVVVNSTPAPEEDKTEKEAANKKSNDNSSSHLQKPPPLPLPEGELESILKPVKANSNSSDTVANGHVPQESPIESVKNNLKPVNAKPEQGKVTVSPPTVTETNFSVKKEPPSASPQASNGGNNVQVTKEIPDVPESNFVVVAGDAAPPTQEPPVITERSAECGKAANDKDFSQTAPWRVSQRKRESMEQPSPPIPDADPIHPWRKSKDSAGGARPKEFAEPAPAVSSPAGGEDTTPTVPVSGGSSHTTQSPSGPDIKPSLILVGKRIESPTTSGEFTFTQVPPYSVESPMGKSGDLGRPIVTVRPSPPPGLSAVAQQYIEEIISLKPSFEHLSNLPEQLGFGHPELLDIPMPTVKEMVADLHRRLEDIAIQHPKIAQLITPQELGLNFQRKLEEKQRAAVIAAIRGEAPPRGEKEIIIDCPPNYSSTLSVDDPRKKRAFLSPSFGSSNFDVTTSPDMQRRRYSLPGTYLTAQTPQHRRVHFAEPVESSVVEIEPRHRKERRREIRPPPVYSSASTLAERLDRIERDNAAASHAMNVSRSSREAERTRLHVPKPLQPSTSPPRTEQILFSSTRPRMEGVTFKPLPQGGRGISLSIGGDGSSQIRLSFTHDRSVPPVIQASNRAGGPGAAQPGFSYSISSKEPPPSRTYSYSPTFQEPGPRVLIQDDRNRLSPSFHSQPGTESPSRSPRTGSPRLDPYYQYRGSPTVPQQQPPPNYSNTLQIDTRSREQQSSQARTPSPVAYGYASPQKMHSISPVPAPTPESPQRQRAYPPGSRPLESPISIPPGSQESPSMKVSTIYTESPARVSPQPRAPPPSMPSPRQQQLQSPMGPPSQPQTSPLPSGQSPQPGEPRMPLPIPGLFALFDKSFADKFEQWQVESQGRGQRQSETYKLVQEMDEEKKYWDEMY